MVVAAYKVATKKGLSHEKAEAYALERLKQAYKYTKGRWLLRNPRPSPTKGRLLKRPPIGSIDGKACAELGALLEIQTETLLFKFSGHRVAMCWFPEIKALVGIEGAAKGRKASPQRGGKAADAYERFNDRGVRAERTDTIKFSPKAQWTTFGRAKRVDYFSDKWGRKQEYTHDLGKSVKLYRYGGTAPPYLWVLKGRSLRVTARGLVG